MTPAASAAADRSRAFSAVSVAWTNAGHHFRRCIARRILNGVTLLVVISSRSIPCSKSASASLTFATQIPTEPVSSCRRAMAGVLCVLACGRLAMPLRSIVRCIVARFASSASRSTTSDGVSRSHIDTPSAESSEPACAANAAISAPE